LSCKVVEDGGTQEEEDSVFSGCEDTSLDGEDDAGDFEDLGTFINKGITTEEVW
jgi:hypothetical protein